MFSGGNLRRLTVFALGIMPYITAAIIFELLTVVYEPLARLQKEGDMGRKKITQWTRYMTVFLAVVQSFAIALTLVKDREAFICHESRPGLCVDDDSDTDRRNDVHHVAGRADYRSWHRQRDEPADLCRHCCGASARRDRAFQKVQTNAWGSFTIIAVVILVVFMAAVVGFIVFVERSGAANSCPVREEDLWDAG